ncbi:hypothetical protein ACFVYC_18625 [Pseudarthrobacter sp. NPDC058329]|uniref:hypothetical protein n=1 Tax=Pseudarthrobacter sp. NPDC058329 TaxID=3346448 RepID=UPI0036D79801
MTEAEEIANYPVTKVPKTPSETRNLLATEPPMWEYLLFAAYLHEGKRRIEPKWRDYHLGLITAQGTTVTKSEVADVLKESMARMQATVGNLDRLMTQDAQRKAFGDPGKPGDPDFIKHLADRIIDMYEELIDWATQSRSLRLPTRAQHMADLTANFVSQPITETRRFIDDFVKDLEAVMNRLKSGENEDTIVLQMPIVFDIPKPILKAYEAGLKKALG